MPLSQLAAHQRKAGPQVSFDRPELSPCLQRFDDPNDPQYQEALALIRAGQEELARRPEADMPGFVACETDQWRESKYLVRQQTEQRNRKALQEGTAVYERREP